MLFRSLEDTAQSQNRGDKVSILYSSELNYMSWYCEGTGTTAVCSKNRRAANPFGVCVVSPSLWQGLSITIKAYWVYKSMYTHDGKHLLYCHKPTPSLSAHTVHVHKNTNNRHVEKYIYACKVTSNHKYTGRTLNKMPSFHLFSSIHLLEKPFYTGCNFNTDRGHEFYVLPSREPMCFSNKT